MKAQGNPNALDNTPDNPSRHRIRHVIIQGATCRQKWLGWCLFGGLMLMQVGIIGLSLNINSH